jgi:hypothetical protein
LIYPKSSVSLIASDTSADLTIKTPVRHRHSSNAALDSIMSQAAGSTVTVGLGTVAGVGADCGAAGGC